MLNCIERVASKVDVNENFFTPLISIPFASIYFFCASDGLDGCNIEPLFPVHYFHSLCAYSENCFYCALRAAQRFDKLH